LGLAFGIIAAVLSYILIYHTVFGFAARVAGGNIRVAENNHQRIDDVEDAGLWPPIRPSASSMSARATIMATTKPTVAGPGHRQDFPFKKRKRP
jgi:hypothetical protein